MKTLFLEAKYEGKVDLSKIKPGRLPDKIGLITTVQFIDFVDVIKKSLKGKKIFVGKGKQIYAGQILGCDTGSADKINDKVDAFLYVGTGKFHPLIVGVNTGKKVFTLNPITGDFRQVDDKTINDYKKRKKGALLKFLNADTVGILVSTKTGQYYDIKKLELLEKKYPEKKFYTFAAETIDYMQMDNFPFVEAWVNTACPRIDEDITIVNVSEIKDL